MSQIDLTNGETLHSEILRGDQIFVYSGGSTHHTAMADGSTEFVYSGGSASVVSMTSGTNFYVSGGTMHDALVNMNAYIYLSAGGTVSDLKFIEGRAATWAGEIDAYDSKINDVQMVGVGTLRAYDGTVVNGVRLDGFVSWDCEFDIVAGSVASNIVGVGVAKIEDIGTVNNVTLTADSLGNDPYLHQGSDGVVNNLTANSGTQVTIQHIANDMTINNAASAYLYQGSVSTDVIINDGGIVTLYAGATLDNVTVNAGGTLINDGGTINGIKNNGGAIVTGAVTAGHNEYAGISASLAVISAGKFNPSLTSAAAPSMLAAPAFSPVAEVAPAGAVAAPAYGTMAVPMAADHAAFAPHNGQVHAGGTVSLFA